MSDAPEKSGRAPAGGRGLALGVALGTALGAAFGNVGAGVALGTALGAAFGLVGDTRLDRQANSGR